MFDKSLIDINSRNFKRETKIINYFSTNEIFTDLNFPNNLQHNAGYEYSVLEALPLFVGHAHQRRVCLRSTRVTLYKERTNIRARPTNKH